MGRLGSELTCLSIAPDDKNVPVAIEERVGLVRTIFVGGFFHIRLRPVGPTKFF